MRASKKTLRELHTDDLISEIMFRVCKMEAVRFYRDPLAILAATINIKLEGKQ